MSIMTTLKTMFPRTVTTRHSAFCERIPMDLFEAMESALRTEMRAHGYKAMYRGPRVSNDTGRIPTMTRRCDATHVLLYRK